MMMTTRRRRRRMMMKRRRQREMKKRERLSQIFWPASTLEMKMTQTMTIFRVFRKRRMSSKTTM